MNRFALHGATPAMPGQPDQFVMQEIGWAVG